MNQFLLELIRAAMREGRARFTEHAHSELLADRLTTIDSESAIRTGRLVRIQPDDSPEEPGPRYTVVGCATDLITNVGVVCRFEPGDQLVIIICYEIK